MRTTIFTLIFTLALAVWPCTSMAEEVGAWRIYPSYNTIEDVEPAGNQVFVKASSNLYSYNSTDDSFITYDKTNYLSDVNLSQISWNNVAKRLVITYENFNIDMLSPNGDVINVPDLYMKVMAGNKNINSITQEGQYAYLATAFGIMKLDVKNAYISDSYILNTSIKHVCIIGRDIYALKETGGVIKANMSDNMNDPSSWKSLNDVFFQYMFTLGNKLIGMTDGNANTIDTTTGEVQPFGYFNFSWAKKYGDRILCGKGVQVTEILSDLSIKSYKSASALNVVGYERTTGKYWANNADNQLVRYGFADGNITQETTGVMPEGPVTNETYRVCVDKNGTLYSINGHYNVDSYTGFAGSVSKMENDRWDYFRENIQSMTGHRYRDLSCIAVSPKDPRIVMVGGETGLYKFVDGKLAQAYDSKNSPIVSTSPTNSEPRNWCLVLGMVYNKEGDLWVTNSKNQNILCLKHDGEWVEFPHPDLLNANYSVALTGALLDQRNYYWFCGTRWDDSRVFCYDIRNDHLKRYEVFVNQDNTRYVPYIKNLAVDKKDNIWIATNKGPFYIKAEDIASGNEVMTQHKVPRNDGTNFADYLLADIDIMCITVDAANRKWIGTNGMGVFVISDDCNTQEFHFTSDNSPLSSDVVTDIQIDSSNGRVYFSTGKGICSYMSGVSESNAEMTDSDVWAYPNPVTPDYHGLITVRGLENGSQVTVTTVSGQKVASGVAVGGSYIWDGNDQNGDRVASGVYMVLVAKPDGKSGIATKIAVVR